MRTHPRPMFPSIRLLLFLGLTAMTVPVDAQEMEHGGQSSVVAQALSRSVR